MGKKKNVGEIGIKRFGKVTIVACFITIAAFYITFFFLNLSHKLSSCRVSKSLKMF